MELWWRCAALEALQAYVMSQLALCTRQEGIRIQKTVASLLQPTLDAIMASPVLQVLQAGPPTIISCLQTGLMHSLTLSSRLFLGAQPQLLYGTMPRFYELLQVSLLSQQTRGWIGFAISCRKCSAL